MYISVWRLLKVTKSETKLVYVTSLLCFDKKWWCGERGMTRSQFQGHAFFLFWFSEKERQVELVHSSLFAMQHSFHISHLTVHTKLFSAPYCQRKRQLMLFWVILRVDSYIYIYTHVVLLYNVKQAEWWSNPFEYS